MSYCDEVTQMYIIAIVVSPLSPGHYSTTTDLLRPPSGFMDKLKTNHNLSVGRGSNRVVAMCGIMVFHSAIVTDRW